MRKLNEKTEYSADLEATMWSEKDNESIRYLLSDSRGRWFMARLMDRTRIHVPLNHDHILLEEGRREVGLEYLNAVQALGLEGMKWLHTMEDEYAAFKINLERMKQQWQKK